MARTYRKPALAAGLALTAAALAQAPAPPTDPAAPATHSVELLNKDQPVQLDAGHLDVDYKTKQMIYHDVVISQGSTRVQSDTAQATGLNFANSKWTFSGNVRINAEPRGNLQSDSAVVEFKDNLITRATVTGKPAQFEQKREGTDQVARGHADKIVYDVTEGTVRLNDDAWLSDGQNEISGPELVYNIRTQRVQANGGLHGEVQTSAPGTPDDRIHITIAPKTARPDAGKSGAPTDPKTPPQPQQ
ncbi:MAG: lipopolysaccharide transport periplasmic protein LptA [Proteobacteria bacterium]|nr:lipopolysaccharide transport periplasmic protein LptA [Pseudomonadota bacterium]